MFFVDRFRLGESGRSLSALKPSISSHSLESSSIMQWYVPGLSGSKFAAGILGVMDPMRSLTSMPCVAHRLLTMCSVSLKRYSFLHTVLSKSQGIPFTLF
jgi:hypothetical protein